MGLFTRRSTSDADRHAAKAYKRGDQVYTRVIHAIPGRIDGGLGMAINRIELAGWKLEQQTEGSKRQAGFTQQYWTCTFRAVPST
ncbi:hypothetical protein M2271_003520 [Streptomyces sp. LBL]|nr:hypothetical protein [Streptomyces sp. LBL]